MHEVKRANWASISEYSHSSDLSIVSQVENRVHEFGKFVVFFSN